MKWVVLFALLSLAITVTLADDPEKKKMFMRCGTCDSGVCKAGEFVVNTCSPYCSPCDDTCQGSYLLSEDSEGNFKFASYLTDNCTSKLDISVEVVCDSCLYYGTGACPAFYLECPSFWWLYTLGVIFVIIILCGILIGVMALIRKRQRASVRYEDVQPVSYQQASYQSTSY